MSNSLRDQLLGLGFKQAPKPERPPQDKAHKRPAGDRPAQAKHGQAKPGTPRPQGKPAHGKPPHGGRKPAGKGGGRPQTREDIDLAKAYASRAQREKDERIAAEAAKQEEARKRREARAKLAELVKDKVEIHDLHATMLYLLGIEHTKLTFRFGGRDMRLTDVPGELIEEILA